MQLSYKCRKNKMYIQAKYRVIIEALEGQGYIGIRILEMELPGRRQRGRQKRM